MIVMLLIEVEPEPEITPFIEDPVTKPRQQGKQTPIDHVYKIPIPSQSRLCMFRRSPCYRFYRIVEPISDA